MKYNVIKTSEDLAKFVLELRDHLQSHPDSWENVTLESYLEAMAAWLNDMSKFQQNRRTLPLDEPLSDLSRSPSWATFAAILSAAKVYE